MKLLTNLDLNKNELQNGVIQKLASAPSSPIKGQIYFNTTSNRAFAYNGTAWVGMDAIDATMTGDQIVTAINGSTSIIDLDNLPSGVGTAVADSHTHSNKTVLDATTASYTIAEQTKLSGITAGASVNSVAAGNGMNFTTITGSGSVALGTPSTVTSSTTNSVSAGTHSHALTVTKTDVGLSNVTNDAQIKKLSSSTIGYIPTWSVTTGDALAAGYSVETSLSGGSSSIPRADAVKTYVDSIISASDAMVYKGTLGTGGTITALPTTYHVGWAYKVITAGTYASQKCQIGDLIIAVITRSGSGNLDSDWTVVQVNIDGAVTTSASSAVNSNFVAFDGTSGAVVKDSGYNSSSFAAASHTHPYTAKYSTTVGDGTNVNYTITHNLNTQDASVTIREVASPYSIVYTDVEMTTVNTITLKFATAPTSGQYKVTVIG